MRQIQKTYTVYRFEELPERMQQKVLEDLWDINLAGNWYESTLELSQETLRSSGFENSKIFYEGAWGGICFDAVVNLEKVIQHLGDKRFTRLLPLVREGYISAIILTTPNSSYYSQCKTRYIELFNDFDSAEYKRVYALCGLLAQYTEALRLRLCLEIQKEVEKDYKFLTSKEMVIETIQANEYEFLDNGKIF